MRTTLVVTAFLLAAMLNLAGASLTTIALPDSVEVAGKTLVLSRVGIRSRLLLRGYVGGLYIEPSSTDALAIVQADVPKGVVWRFLRPVSREQMVAAYREAFVPRPRGTVSFTSEIDALVTALGPVSAGEDVQFTYVPGTGLTLAVGGRDTVTIAGAAFTRALFSAWLGPAPSTSTAHSPSGQ